ncbi:HAD-IIB family hydrolase [Sphingomonas sp. TDK1]|uniref:HAD-IIB family hydrolase n=1 Tax=Sphingomonas sp. TDK1 TaxID=453247 RepID=UPI0007D9FCAE|nr:HAD-IIB family hydrolase [Sphingomonas sp. TDK1]OAN62277.1 HAD family hydrolase [Sphingomonas sp. TDK1]
MKRLIAFDLDGTLAESKQPLEARMASSLSSLLDILPVAVISGGDCKQFDVQVISRLPPGTRLDRLFIMPTTGAKLYRFREGAWQQIYAESFTPEERERILTALNRAVGEAGLTPAHLWGEQIEDRGTQITFSALGQEAPVDAKKAWDPDQAKRAALQRTLAAQLPGFSIRIGGTTSLDITRQGVDKAYAIARLETHAELPRAAMLFLGDALYPGGNDDPVRAAGVDSIRVRDPAETGAIIDALVAWNR